MKISAGKLPSYALHLCSIVLLYCNLGQILTFDAQSVFKKAIQCRPYGPDMFRFNHTDLLRCYYLNLEINCIWIQFANRNQQQLAEWTGPRLSSPYYAFPTLCNKISRITLPTTIRVSFAKASWNGMSCPNLSLTSCFPNDKPVKNCLPTLTRQVLAKCAQLRLFFNSIRLFPKVKLFYYWVIDFQRYCFMVSWKFVENRWFGISSFLTWKIIGCSKMLLRHSFKRL